MKFENVSLSIARIHGLNNPPQYSVYHFHFLWDLVFSDTALPLQNLSDIYVGQTELEAKVFCNKIRKNFETAGIMDDANVAILLNDKGNIIALSSLNGINCWLDVNNDFTPKPFEDFNIVIKSLKVCN